MDRLKLWRVGGTGTLATVVMLVVGGAPVPAPDATAGQSNGTVTFHGRAGSFGQVGETVPSGQEAGRVAVPGWSFPAGRGPDRTVVADDGTVFMAAADLNGTSLFPTGTEAMLIAAFEPQANEFNLIRIGTMSGRRPATLNQEGLVAVPSIADLVPLPGGMVLFATGQTRPGLDRTTDGDWPAIGILQKSDGGWRIGDHWPETHLAAATGIHRVVRLPGSGHLIATQLSGELLALQLIGPDTANRFTIKVVGRSQLTAGGKYELRIDPTGKLGAERFAVHSERGDVHQFSYIAATGEFRERSAAQLPTDSAGFKSSLYDRAGNLWLTRFNGFSGGKIAVIPPAGPRYDLAQAGALPQITDLVEDIDTGTVIAISHQGHLMPTRLRGSGRDLVFEIGNIVDIGRKLLPTAPGNELHHGAASAGRGSVWWPIRQDQPSTVGARTDHWLVRVELADLFSPRPVRLPETPGRSATIQAERTITTRTANISRGPSTVEVQSYAMAIGCDDWPGIHGCAYDGRAGNGFMLGNYHLFDQVRGPVDYRIMVPVAGSYRLMYHGSAYSNAPSASAELTIAGRTYRTPMQGPWHLIRCGDLIELSAGEQAIRLDSGGLGWSINYIVLQRV